MFLKRHAMLVCLLLICSLQGEAQRFMWWNVENLFDCKDDSLHEDEEFLPEGDHHWTLGRYWRKMDNIARVIAAVSEESGWPALVGEGIPLQERINDSHVLLAICVDVVALVFGLDHELSSPSEKTFALELVVDEPVADIANGEKRIVKKCRFHWLGPFFLTGLTGLTGFLF